MKRREAQHQPASQAASLPIERTSFIGRKRELVEVRRLLESKRLVTLTGPAGCGKTRLALWLASEIAAQAVFAVYWVELASLAEGGFMVQKTARVLRIAESTERSAIDSLLAALGGLVLLVLSPLKNGWAVFVAGMATVAVGLAGLVKALFDFKNTPLDEPVRRGMYRISRHPQIVMSTVVLLGAALAVGSGLILALFVAARVLSHFGILAEEEKCLEQYGEPYRAYMQQVPRYLLVF